MALQTENLVMVGLSIENDQTPNSIQPKLKRGIHLRWAFKREMGFPWYGYYLFRRPHHSGDPQKVRLDGASLQPGSTTMNSAEGQVKSDSFLALINFLPTGAIGFDLDWRNSLQFIPSELASRIEVRIGFTQSTEIKITAFLKQTPVAQIAVVGNANQEETVSLESDAISSLEFSSGPAVLLELGYVPVAGGNELVGWGEVPNFPYPMSLPVTNPRYPLATGKAEALALKRILYGPQKEWAGARFADLHGELVKLVDGVATGTPMAQKYSQTLATPPSSPQLRMPKQYPLDLVLLGTLHPAIAQMIGLYWVDQPNTPNQDPNFANQVYDYLVVAAYYGSLGNKATDALDWLRRHGFNDVDAFIIFNKSLKDPALPLDVPSGLKTYALPAGALQSQISASPQQENNAGLRWDLGVTELGALLPGKPVMYHLWRAGLGNGENPNTSGRYDLITKSGPLLVVEPGKPNGKLPERPSDWPPDHLHYLDTGLADGWYSYQVSGIDIFGRHSENSAPGPWYQWTPAPDPKPWYYKEPPPADSIVHPSAVRLIDTLPPPPPTGIEAYALDPQDPTVVKDAAYNDWWNSLTAASWYQALTEEQKKELIGLRVRWLWTHSHIWQAPDTREFRIYYHADPMNVLMGKIRSVTAANAKESDVETDILNSLLADAYQGMWLQVGNDAFKVVSSQAGSPLHLRVMNIGPKNDIKPRSNAPCALAIPEKHPSFVDYSVAMKWQERYYVVDYNSNVAQSLIPAHDPKGNNLEGTAAVVTGTKVSLDGAPDLSDIQLTGEHIFLMNDTNRPDKTYPIVTVDNVAKTVTVDGNPKLGGGASAWEIGFPLRTYELFLPTPDGTFNSSLSLLTSLAEPIKYAHISVSAADDKSYISDQRTTRRWANHTGNEGRVGARAKIFRVRREPPEPPAIPVFDSDKVYATPADYHNHSFYTFRWIAAANVKVHISRALDGSVFEADWAWRKKQNPPFVLSSNDRMYFPPELLKTDAATIARLNDVINKLNGLNTIIATGSVDDVRAVYRALTNDALRVLAGLPGSASAFTQLTIQPLDPNDSANANRRGPNDPDEFVLGDPSNPLAATTLCAYVDTLDGRSTNAYFYRAGSVDGVHNRSKELSLSSPPVYCPDVVPPKRPTLLEAAGGKTVITLRWIESVEEDLDYYILYRTDSHEAFRDLRLMTPHKRIAKIPTATLRPGEVAPAPVTNESGHSLVRRLQIEDVVPPNVNYHYRLVAVDMSGNLSESSAVVSGRAYQPPPDPPSLAVPVWDMAHQKVTLMWTSPDANLESRVERRRASGGTWQPVAEWLLKGVYAYVDVPPDPAELYEYRIKVRDSLGQINGLYEMQTTP